VRTVRTYVETGVAMAYERAAAAWVFDLDVWGRVGQGLEESSAVAALRAEIENACGHDLTLVVVERAYGDEQVFDRDRAAATHAEIAATLGVLTAARHETLALIRGCPDHVLDRDDPDRTLPSWARWRTLRQLAWHIADTESRYYLPSLGLPARIRGDDLVAELVDSAAHVREHVLSMERDRVVEADGEVWTTTKLLRRLAWHERSELRVMRELRWR
jgi:hypothetical protein